MILKKQNTYLNQSCVVGKERNTNRDVDDTEITELHIIVKNDFQISIFNWKWYLYFQLDENLSQKNKR